MTTNGKITKNGKSWYCNVCDYTTYKKSHWNKHIVTKKHIRLTYTADGNKQIYSCICGKEYRHRQSLFKHKINCSVIKKQNEVIELVVNDKNDNKNDKNDNNINAHICLCGKSYKYLSGFSRHKKTCEIYKNKSIIPVNENVQTNDIIKSSDLQNIIQSITTSKGKDGETTIINININNTYENIQTKAEKVNNNNNNTFNVMNYLNTECKDAYNLEDYAKNYAVTFKHLDDLHNKGCVKAYTDNFISDIKKLPHNKRPIHCTDAKRKSFQVKNKGVWVRDVGPDNEIIVDSLKTITNNQCDTLKQWKNLNKDWLDDERKQEFANKTTRNIVDIYTDTIQKKIINNLTCLNPNPTKSLSL
jgi:acetone carboxylase gamma subunit